MDQNKTNSKEVFGYLLCVLGIALLLITGAGIMYLELLGCSIRQRQNCTTTPFVIITAFFSLETSPYYQIIVLFEISLVFFGFRLLNKAAS